MRLSTWRSQAPDPASMAEPVLAVLDPVLAALGGAGDPHAWVQWGDEPATRYTLLVVTPAGLVFANVRVSLPSEGPRVGAKLVRWPRVQVGELAVETNAGHRLLSFQVEGLVVRGIDAEADRVAAFARLVFAAADGRPWPDLDAEEGVA